MTGYTVHTGSTEKFASGWDRIFQGNDKSAERRSDQASSEKQSGEKSEEAKKRP